MKKLAPFFLFVVLFNLLLLSNSIYSGLQKADIGYYFKEAKCVTFFSALFLGLTSFVSGLLAYLHCRRERLNPVLNFWSLSSIGFFYLMLDEYFMIHEGMDRAILTALGLPERIYNFDGIILGLFGMAGLIILWKCWEQLCTYKTFITLSLFAFICFIFMVIADEIESFNIALRWSA
jgi:hypothetical protein